MKKKKGEGPFKRFGQNPRRTHRSRARHEPLTTQRGPTEKEHGPRRPQPGPRHADSVTLSAASVQLQSHRRHNHHVYPNMCVQRAERRVLIPLFNYLAGLT